MNLYENQQGVNILGNTIEGNLDSPSYNYYGQYQVYARHLLGYSYQPLNYTQLYPSALEHYETSMRDPAFYQLYKKLLVIAYKYKYQLKPYTYKDLEYQGVKVSNFQFDNLVTYFDYVNYDLSNAVYLNPEEYVQEHFKVQVAQKRLNYKPFSYKINVDSESASDVVVKVYLGPKYDEYGRFINLTYNWMNFVQFDSFKYSLKSGQNVITRNSKEMINYIHDRTTYYQLYQQAFGVYDKTSNFGFYGDQFVWGFPQRYLFCLNNVFLIVFFVGICCLRVLLRVPRTNFMSLLVKWFLSKLKAKNRSLVRDCNTSVGIQWVILSIVQCFMKMRIFGTDYPICTLWMCRFITKMSIN